MCAVAGQRPNGWKGPKWALAVTAAAAAGDEPRAAAAAVEPAPVHLFLAQRPLAPPKLGMERDRRSDGSLLSKIVSSAPAEAPPAE